ncbi:PREDICTED: methyltransferase-like protein 13 [Camelina sativa]|uniref:Methyltransferase-like protein 13 n=1 Tax=Camelina sativa TaxID=90675 RepID=A0ABM0TB44_CAMSA|nr:PREDICTED: methyltransferase-like protein 13 [Camelina sativa]
MALDVRIFENISPSRFVSFTIPNPNSPPFHLLRVAVLDSPVHSTESSSSPRAVAAILVPKHRESDWIFSTESGHLQLLLNLPDISRLFLIGDDPDDGSGFPAVYHRPTGEDDDESKRLEMTMKPFVVALSPKTLTRDEIDDVPFLIYDDNVVSSVELERSVGPFVGEMLIEDVEIEIDDGVREFRRRLRFKRMPNLVQSDVRIIPASSSNCSPSLTGTEFNLDLTELVHPYLVPMVASLSLIDDSQSDKLKSRPKALCIGVGGGGLLSFLRIQLGFEVTGVEIDPEVLRIARQYFGLEESSACVHVEDGIEFLKRCSSSCGDAKFDALMVDLDSTDPIHGMTAPPVEFVAQDVLLAARTLLVPSGVFVINVIPPNKAFYQELQDKFRHVFTELYEIDVGNGENFVLIATVSPRGLKSGFTRENLTPAVSEKFLDAIRRI